MNHPALLRPLANPDAGPATGELSTHARTPTPAGTLHQRLQSITDEWSLTRTRDILLPKDRWTWARAQILIAEVPVDGAVARAWLPPALALPDTPVATVFIAHYPDTAMGFAYREAGVLLHARLRGRTVMHCAWMVVDDDTAMILGRELLGFPKKMARIDFDAFGSSGSAARPEASVVRRGVQVLRFNGIADGEAPRTAAFAHPIVNTRGIPGALPNLMLSMQPNERCHASDALRLHIATGDSPCDPLATLGIAGEHTGRRLVVDLGSQSEDDAPLFPALPAAVVNPAWLWKAYPFRSW